MCKRFMVIILVLGVLFVPAIAFAEQGGGHGFDSYRVVYGPTSSIANDDIECIAYADNKYTAAFLVCGFDYLDYMQLTDETKAKLSNASTGGAFYEFANTFSNSLPTLLLQTYQLMYPSNELWYSSWDDSTGVLTKSRNAVLDIIQGGGGAGGGSPISGTTCKWLLTNYYYTYTIDAYPSKGTIYYGGKEYRLWTNPFSNPLRDANMPTGNTFTLNNIPTTIDTSVYSDAICVFIPNGNSARYSLVFAKPNTYEVNIVEGSSLSIVFNEPAYQYKNNNAGASYNSMPFDYTANASFMSFRLSSNTISETLMWQLSLNVSGDAPVVPPTQWPEPDPVTPTEPPEVPSPTPTEPPTEPTITVPTIPTLPPLTYPTEPTYATPDIASILDAMAKHCVHLQECMKNVSNDYYESMTAYMLTLQNKDFEFFRSWFRVTLDTIRDCFDDLSDYLQRLFTWLADQMDFTFTGGDYDDSSIVWWLKRIYSKLGSGTTVRPTDPVVDPKGIGDWFDQLLKNFVLDLLALGQDALADVTEMFRQLVTKFPFSIPWDIAAMLALFAATPQIPVIDIPQYALTGNGISQVGMYTIDLTPYDGAMGIARSVENVVFAFWLAWKIDFFKAILTGVLGGDK